MYYKLKECNHLDYLTDASGVIIHPGLDSLHLSSFHFPPLIPTLKKLSFKYTPQSIPDSVHLFSSLESLKVGLAYSERGSAAYSEDLIIPSSFYQLSNLEYLDIAGDHLSDSIRYLQKVKNLSLYISNSTSGRIPDSISCLKGLEHLSIYGRDIDLRALPNSIYKLTNLKSLNLVYFSLSDSIRYLTELRELSIARAKRLPDGLFHLKKLQKLDLRSQYTTMKGNWDQIKTLDTLFMGSHSRKKKVLINARKLKTLQHLKHIQFSIPVIRNEWHYRQVYNALPEGCGVELNDGWESNAPYSTFNVGFYMDYSWGHAVFTGIELLYYFAPRYKGSFVKKAGNFGRQATTKKHQGTIPNPFYFHTFSFGLEWNYLQSSDFLMGHRIGYTYSRVKEPIFFQVDLISYTNYKNTFDLRLAPRIGIIPIRTYFIDVYLYYSYKIPLLFAQEQSVVSPHSLGCSVRFTLDWSDGVVGFPGVF